MTCQMFPIPKSYCGKNMTGINQFTGFVCLTLTFIGLTTLAHAQELQISIAEEKYRAAEQRYESLKKLSESGSASKQQVRKADFNRKVALIELSSLLDPATQEKNMVLKARLIYRYRLDELKTARPLYERGSLTEVKFRRIQTAVEIAKSNLKAAESYNETQQKMQAIKIANSQLKLAKEEHAIAKQLFEKGSLSESQLELAQRNLRIAEAKLKSAKAQLKASAVQVKQ